MNVILKWLKGIKEDSLSQNQMVMKYDFPEIYIARKAIIVKAYAKTLVAESKLLTAIYNSGHVTDVTIMNREADGLYTLRVETSALTTPRGLRNRIAKQLVNL